MQSGADKEVEGSIWLSACFLFLLFPPVPHQDYSQGGFNLQQGLMLVWVLLLMTSNKKQELRGEGKQGVYFLFRKNLLGLPGIQCMK